MFQIEWFDEQRYLQQTIHDNVNFISQLSVTDLERVLSVHWEEHCIECAPPTCYSTCPLFLARKDKKCRNLYYGIYRNKAFNGLFGYGAEIKFKKWGKIETELHLHAETIEEIRKIENSNEKIVKAINMLYGPLVLVDKKRKLNGVYTLHKRKKLRETDPNAPKTKFDDFVIECYSFESAPFRLIIENKNNTPFRTSVNVVPGSNFFVIPVREFKFEGDIPGGTLSIYPENDLEANVVFTWLDFVKYKFIKKENPEYESGESGKPAAKVKCVAWDLDNTLWKGIFIESKPSDLILNKDAIELIKKFDEMGIIQTAISKNTEEDLMPFLKEKGVEEYFLYPAINWGQKSENLKNIANELNINIDTFAVIDDSPFERSEISTSLPQVRVYSDQEINELLTLPEFDTPITEEGRNRRKFYKTEQMRNQISESFSGDYKRFLKNCDFHLNIFVPDNEQNIKRCYELIQRTNQLNVSSKRYTPEEFDAIMKDPTYLKYAFDCRDKFGDYGIVGFCIVKSEAASCRITDFVISCRVAQKLVEHSFVFWLFEKMHGKGLKDLYVDYVKTTRNAPILTVFQDMQFEQQEHNGTIQLYKNADTLVQQEKIITVHEQ